MQQSCESIVLVGSIGSGKTVLARHLLTSCDVPSNQQLYLHGPALLHATMYESLTKLSTSIARNCDDRSHGCAIAFDDIDCLLVGVPPTAMEVSTNPSLTQHDTESILLSEILHIHHRGVIKYNIRRLIVCVSNSKVALCERVFSPRKWTYRRLPDSHSLSLCAQLHPRSLLTKGQRQLSAPHIDHVVGMSHAVSAIRSMMLSDSDPLAANLLPRGIILYGPPASGKTFLCRVIGNSLGRNVVFASVADVVSKVVGETERKISDLFTQARSRAPSVLVFDPIDPFAKRRVGHESGFSADQVLTALLTELDGLGSHNRGVLVVATAHNIDALDEAVLRSGRLELHIRLLEPSVSDMVALLLRRCANATLTVSASDAEKCIVNAKCKTFADVESLYQETVMRYIRSLDRATATVTGLEEAFSRLAVSTQPIISPTVPDPKSCTPQ